MEQPTKPWTPMQIAETPLVPSFFLYGEPPRELGDRFLHLESLDDRSRPSDWNIRPHAHVNLHHVFLIIAGAGEMRTEQGNQPFAAPAVLLVPAGVIHAFTWQPETTGHVLTLSDRYAEELFAREPRFVELFRLPLPLGIAAGEDQAHLTGSLQRLARELTWGAPGHIAAVEAHLVAFMVEVLRLTLRRRQTEASLPGRQAELVARFRQAVETGFRAARPLPDYAAGLNITVPQLRAACLKIARKSPARLVQDRITLEAKRLLLYSNMTIAELAYSLGFEDPAYFSRFFRKATQQSPRGFRAGALR